MNKKQFKENFGMTPELYDEYKKSIPENVDYFHISSCSDKFNFGLNFKIETKSQIAYFGLVNTSMSDSNKIWQFVESLCEDCNITSFFIDEEGCGPTICTEDIGNGKIRLTIITNIWKEFNFDKELEILKTKVFKKHDYRIQFDAIINRKDFIYQMYLELLYAFSEDNYEKGHGDGVSTWLKMTTDSKKIKKYLGYTKAKKLDLKLCRLLGEFKAPDTRYIGSIEEIEALLNEGANPNAITDTVSFAEDKPLTIFDCAVCQYASSLCIYRLGNETEYFRTVNNVKIRNDFFQKHRDEIQDKQTEVINLLAKYGGRTLNSKFYKFFNLKFNYYRIAETILRNSSKITPQLRNNFLQLDNAIIKLFKEYKVSNSYLEDL